MLERLEISEVLISKVKNESYSHRWDSNYFLKEFLFSPLENVNTDLIENLFVIKSGTTPKDRDETLKEGVILLKTNDIRNNVLKDKGDSFFYINEEINSKMNSTQLEPNDVLINIVGATTNVIGRVSYISDTFPNANITQAMSLMRAKQSKITSHYLFCFLLSKYGNMQVRRFARPTGQYNMNHSELGGFEIPLLTLNFQQNLKELILNNNIIEIKSQKLYSQAETILLQEIGLDEKVTGLNPVKVTKNTVEGSNPSAITDNYAERKGFSAPNINVKNFAASFGVTGRLDAEYYQKKYEVVIEKIKSQNYNTLQNIVTITKSLEPGSDYYSDDATGLPFMRVADYNKFGLSEPNKKLTFDFIKDNQDKIDDLKPKKGSILFSKDGSVGTAYHLREDFEGITSSAILNLKVRNEKEVIPEYLTLALNSKLVQMQAERDAGGSIILHWRIGEIQNVVVPIIDYNKQQEIAKLIEESFSLKKQSEHLLELAKRAVEIAIEENEEIAMKHIDNNSIF